MAAIVDEDFLDVDGVPAADAVIMGDDSGSGVEGLLELGPESFVEIGREVKGDDVGLGEIDLEDIATDDFGVILEAEAGDHFGGFFG